jgi:succinoglycan biosynthesis protein ExoO
MSNPAIISVIMPAYNAATTIITAVHSVLNQTIRNLELIICDDASTDGTLEIISTFKDERLKFIRNKQNRGPGHSRDRGIELASAPWVAFIDADDAWQPERLEKLLNAAGDSKNVLVFDDIMVCHDVNGEMVPWRSVHGKIAFATSGSFTRDISLESYITSPRLLAQPMISSSFIRAMRIRHSNRRFAEDAEYYLRLAAAGIQFRYLPEPLYLYRVTAGSATSHASITQMRECIEDCAHLIEWPSSIQKAFEIKIQSLHHNETLYAAAAHLSAGRFLSAMRMLAADPPALRVLPNRAFTHLKYQLHRLRLGGRGRTAQES